MAEYPQHLVRQRVLFDGTPATIRPIRPEDSGMEQEFVRPLPEDSRYFRFMGSMRELPLKKLKVFTEIDYQRHMAFVATITRDGKELEIGVARYVATEDPGHPRAQNPHSTRRRTLARRQLDKCQAVTGPSGAQPKDEISGRL